MLTSSFRFHLTKKAFNTYIKHQQLSMQSQLQAMRHPRMEMGSLRSFLDLDGIASDAVEGRSKQLEFYRNRPQIEPRFTGE